MNAPVRMFAVVGSMVEGPDHITRALVKDTFAADTDVEYIHVDHSKKLLNDRLELMASIMESFMYDEVGVSQLNTSEAYSNYLRRRLAMEIRSFKLEML